MHKYIKFGLLILVFLIFTSPMWGTTVLVNNQINSWQTDNGSIIPSKPTEKYEVSSGEAWLVGWQYRLQIEFIESESSGTNYQIKITVNYDDAGDHYEINCSSACQTDFDDIRFTDNDGSTELYYYREEYTASDDATFWVKVTDSLSDPGVCVIYIYWGNAGVSNTNDIDNTFIWADDFENNNLNKWSVPGAYWSTASAQKKYGSYSAYGDAGATGASRTLTEDLADISADFALHCFMRKELATRADFPFYPVDEGGTAVYAICAADDTKFKYYNGTAYYQYGTITYAADTWYMLDLGFSFADNKMYLSVDDVVDGASYNLKDGSGGAVTSITTIRALCDSSAGYDIWLDNFFIRKYNYPEPSISWILTGANSVEDGAPVVDASSVCKNLDDTDNIYGMYKSYIFTSNVSSVQGYAQIDYIEMSLQSGVPAILWTAKYAQDTDTFSESLDDNNYITLETGSCSDVSATTNIDITWSVLIHWNHTDVADYDLYTKVVDAGTASDDDTANVNYDVETRLDYSAAPALSDGSGTADRGNYNTEDSVTAGGTVIYYTSTDNYPPTGAIDVWASCADVAGTPWSDTTIASGVFSMTVDSDDAVGQDTYTFKVVAEGAGSAGTDLYYTTSVTDTYIADRVQVQEYSMLGDDRVNINENKDIYVKLFYDYDNTNMSNGVVTVNGDSFTNVGGGSYWWLATISKATPQVVTYNAVVVSGNTHGITAEDQNGQSQVVTWDQIIVMGYTTNSTDNRDDINDYFNVNCWLQYGADNTNLTDGTVVINGISFTYKADGNWTANVTKATAQTLTLNSAVCGGNTYGITEEDNTITLVLKWDSLVISFTDPTDQRANLNANATGLAYTVTYSLGGTYDGTVTLNNTDYNGDGTAVRWGYTISSAAGDDTYGITEISINDDTYMIWDSLTITIVVTDQRIDINMNISISVSATYDYDSAAYDGTFTCNDTLEAKAAAAKYAYSFIADGDDSYGITTIGTDDGDYCIWDSLNITAVAPTDQRINIGANASGMAFSAIYNYDSATYDGTFTLNDTTYDHGVVGIYGYTVASANGDDTYGITAILDNDETNCIFDQLKVLGYTSNSTDNHDNINTPVNITVWVQYDYDDANVTDGTITINSESFVYDSWLSGGGNWTLTTTEAASTTLVLNTLVAAGNIHGITSVNQNSKSLTYIWDSLTITIVVTDQRINTGTNITISVSATYDEGGAYGGTFTCNDTLAALDSVGKHFYSFTADGDDTYGITAIGTDDSDYCIWDNLTITIVITDQRININVNLSMTVSAVYNYDSTSYDGTFTLNDTLAAKATASKFFYTVTSADGDDTYGITLIETNDVEYCIWDSLTITITVTDQRININTNITISVSATYDYDNTAYDGTFTCNDTLAAEVAAVRNGYNFTADGDDTYGISTIGTTDSDYCIWDSLTVSIVVSDNRINVGVNITISVSAVYDYDAVSYDGTFTSNDTLEAKAAVGRFGYSFTADGDDTYGITAIATDDSDYCIWDRICVYEVYPDADWDASNFWAWESLADSGTVYFVLMLEYDGWTVYGDSYVNDTLMTRGGEFETYQHWHRFTFPGTYDNYSYVLTASSEPDYGITAINANASAWLIWDGFDITFNTFDTRIDVNSAASFVFMVQNLYNATTLHGTSGTFGYALGALWCINTSAYVGLNIAPNATNYFIFDDTEAIVTKQQYLLRIQLYAAGVIEIYDYLYNIIEWEPTDAYSNMIWDQIEVWEDGYTYPWTRVDVGTNVTIWASARLQYDNHSLGSGDTIKFGGEIMTWNGTYFTGTFNKNEPGEYEFTLNITDSFEATYGITVGTNNPVNVTFDRILVYSMWTNDTYVDIGEAFEVWVSLVSEYDNESMAAGLVQLNGTLGTEVAGNINMTFSAGSQWYNYTTFQTFGNRTFQITWANWTTYNLTTINYNGWNVTYLWSYADRIIVMGYESDSTDNRDNINDVVNITVWLQYESDSTNVTDGTITINGQIFTYNAAIQNWTALNTSATAISVAWNDVVSSGDNTRNIVVVNQNGQAHSHIWDSLTITIVIADHRISINTNLSMTISAIYDYDSTAYDGTFTVNDTLIARTNVSLHYYTVSAADGDDSYAITAISVNDIDYLISDALQYEVTVIDNRIDINTLARVWVNITWAYDRIHFTSSDGTATLNGSALTYSSGSGWYRDITYAAVSDYYFVVDSITDTTYGITEILEGTAFLGGMLDIYVTDTFTAGMDVDNFTFSFWIWPDAGQLPEGGDSDYYYLFTLAWTVTTAPGDYADDYKWMLYMVNDTNIIKLVFYSDLDTDDINFEVSSNFDTEGLWNAWNHIVITISQPITGDAIVNTWINGIHIKDDISTNGEWPATGGTRAYMYTGHYRWDAYHTGTNYFSGLLYDVRMFDRTFEDAECQALYAHTFTDETDLVFEKYSYVQERFGSHGTYLEYDFIDSINVYNFTISFWFYPESGWFDSEADYYYIISAVWDPDNEMTPYDSGYPFKWTIYMSYESSKAVMYFYSFWATDYIEFKITSDFDTDGGLWNDWNHITINCTHPTSGNDRFDSWINGVQIGDYVDGGGRFPATSAVPKSIFVGDVPFYVSAGDVLLYGYVRDVKIYDTTLSELNVADLYADIYIDELHLVFDRLSTAQGQIWDGLTVTIVVTDNRINVSLDNISISVSAVYDYDSSAYDGTFTCNDTLEIKNVVGIFSYSFTADGDDTYGITAIVTDDSDYCIWDQIIVRGYTSNDTQHRANINTNFNVSVWLQYEYDNTNLTTGSITINGDTFTYQSTIPGCGNWTAIVTLAIVGDETYDTVVAGGDDTYGISSVNQDSMTITVIWDQIDIYNLSVSDYYISLGSSATVACNALLEYDSHALGTGDTVTFNSVAMTWNGTYFTAIITEAITGYYEYWFATTGNEVSYGITIVDSRMWYWNYLNGTGWANGGTFEAGDSFTVNGTSLQFTAVYNSGADDMDYLYASSTATSTASGFIDYCIFSWIDDTSLTTGLYPYNFAGMTAFSVIIFNVDFSSYDTIYLYAEGTAPTGYTLAQMRMWIDQTSGGATDWRIYVFYYGARPMVAVVFDDVNVLISDAVDQILYTGEAETGVVGSGIYDWGAVAYDGMVNTNITTTHSTPINHTFVVTTLTGDDTYGITSIGTNTDVTWIVWDKINLTITANYDWSIVGYNVTLSASGVFYLLGYAWNGTATWNATTTHWPNQTIAGQYYYGNTTFTSITETDYGVIAWNVVTGEYVTWDNVTGTVLYTFSYLNATTSLFQVYLLDVKLASNNTYLSSSWILMDFNNGTWFFNHTGTGAYSPSPVVGSLGTPTSTTITFTSNATATLGARSFNFQWYTIAAVPAAVDDWNEIYFYGPNGVGLDPLLFKIYVDGARVSSYKPGYYGSVGDTINVTVLNYLDETVYTNVSVVVPANRFIDFEIPVYTLTVWNQCPEFIYFNITSAGGAQFTVHMGQEIYRLAIYASTTYTYTFTVLEGPSAGTITGSINISSDYGIKIDSWDSLELYEGVQRVGGGGKISTEDIAIALSAVAGDTLSGIQMALWILGGIMLFGFGAVAYIRRDNPIVSDTPAFTEEKSGIADESSVRTRERKKETPEQLKPHEFKSGMLNPNFTGGHALDEMSADIWARLKGEKPPKRKKRKKTKW